MIHLLQLAAVSQIPGIRKDSPLFLDRCRICPVYTSSEDLADEVEELYGANHCPAHGGRCNLALISASRSTCIESKPFKISNLSSQGYQAQIRTL